jgi:hypothetical protein
MVNYNSLRKIIEYFITYVNRLYGISSEDGYKLRVQCIKMAYGVTYETR